MILVILKIILFARGKNAEVRVTNTTAKNPAFVELWIESRRYGWMHTGGIALNQSPSIADEIMDSAHIVAFNWFERVIAFLLIRHYLKRDVRATMRAVTRLIEK